MVRTSTLTLLILCGLATTVYPQASKLNRAVRTAENLEPSIPHLEQARESRKETR